MACDQAELPVFTCFSFSHSRINHSGTKPSNKNSCKLDTKNIFKASTKVYVPYDPFALEKQVGNTHKAIWSKSINPEVRSEFLS